MYSPTDLSVSGPQLVKLYKGLPVQLTKESLQNCNSRCLMHPQMAKVVEKARKTGKGCRIVMSPDEIMRTGERGMNGSGMSGTGWLSDSWNWLKQKVPAAFNWARDTALPVVKSAINSDFYQQNIKPVVKSKLHGLLEGAPYSNITEPAADWIGEQTNAFGVKKPKRIGKPKNGGSFKNPGY